ncbi:MAG: DUF2974 domain-containing protein [Clostridia bacterium]|nr:DUF2974 domain-containing protein [Clostridia bacterium]
MPNIMDYLEWRGDLTFVEAPLCEVDNLIFCLLSYVDLDGIVPQSVKEGRITLREAAAEYFFTHPNIGERPLGFIIPADTLILFRRMAHTRRFRDLSLTGYVNEISEKRQTQFAALTVLLPKEEMFVAFRGTDDTIVGWKEDFNLSFMDEIPAQRRASEYINEMDIPPDTQLYIGGHSKGGNLAVWSAVHAKKEVQRMIRQVYSNDGPGFSANLIQTQAYKVLSDRIRVMIPEDSLVGLLLDQDPRYTVVKSNRRGLFQHDGLSWEVLGGQFMRARGLSNVGKRNDTVVRERIASMTPLERENLIRFMFTLLESTGAKTLTELHRIRVRAALTALKTFREMPEEDQETASYLWDKLMGNQCSETKSYSSIDKAKVSSHKSRGKLKISFFPLLLP